MQRESDFRAIYSNHRNELYRNEEEWKLLMETGHPHLIPIRESMLAIGDDQTARCSLCFVPQIGYENEVQELRDQWQIKDLDQSHTKFQESLLETQLDLRVTRMSKRNELFCNCCDSYIAAFPGGADVELPVMVTDVRKSTPTITNCTPAEGAVLGLELRKQVSEIASSGRGYMLQDRGDGFMHSFPYGFAPSDVENRKTWALTHAVETAMRLALETLVPSPTESPMRLGIGLSHGSTYVGAPDIDVLPNKLDMILVLGSATATISARLSDLAEAGTAVVALDTLNESGIVPAERGWKIETLDGAIVPAVRITP